MLFKKTQKAALSAVALSALLMTALAGCQKTEAVLLNLQNLSGRQVRHDIPFDMNARTGNGIGISKRASGLIPSAPASPLIVSPV